MPIISRVGRRTFKIRVLIFTLYLILVLGGITMVYPFALMLATSITTNVDMLEFRLLPRYLYQDEILFQKYLGEKDKLEFIAWQYQKKWVKVKEITLPSFPVKKIESRVRDWREFKKQAPSRFQFAYFKNRYSHFSVITHYRLWLKKRFGGEIEKLNKAYLETAVNFNQLFPPFEDPDVHRWYPLPSLKMKEWKRWVADLPPQYLKIISIHFPYSKFLKHKYENNIQQYNQAHHTDYQNFYQIRLPATCPENEKKKEEWEEFLREWSPVIYLKLKGGEKEYQLFLQKKYQTIEALNKAYQLSFTCFEEVKLPFTCPLDQPVIFNDWVSFIEEEIPLKYLGWVSSEDYYQNFLKEKYKTIGKLNKTYGTHYRFWSEIFPPRAEDDYLYFLNHRRQIRVRFLVGNYERSLDFMLFHGRAIFNTIVLVVGIILTRLTVNPLAAYALSRFNLRYAHRVLLFFLATMAFPAEVTMIPNFLLLKQFRLLNTYWALILPTVANGYSIFLLKGFFDSLPDELYETAIIDGASELRIFWSVTLPLSKPILAVIALNSFIYAYGSFIWAFLVCQNPKMWTLMVFLYEFQHTNPLPVVMSALVLSAIPPLILFIVCQRIILKGIIIPVFK